MASPAAPSCARALKSLEHPAPALALARIAARVACLALAVAAMSCAAVVGVGTPCSLDADCPGSFCDEGGFCAVAAPPPAGDDDDDGEGDGAEGDDAGEGDAGEGDAAEGEGGEGDAGEGDAGDEGEGEGDASEGEEGEGEEVLPRTCREVLDADDSAPSGEFALDTNGDGSVDGTFFCDMVLDGGGYTRIALVDAASIAAAGCPQNWVATSVANDGFAGCARKSNLNNSFVSATFNAPFPWRSVAGKVSAFASGNNDAFGESSNNIESAYVDGVSVTIGAPRQHVFTFAAGHPDDSGDNKCPCISGGAQAPQFVEGKLFCDKSNGDDFDVTNVQWGEGTNICSPDPSSFNGNIFVRSALLATAAATPIDVRIMGSQPSSDEDVGIKELQLFVRED